MNPDINEFLTLNNVSEFININQYTMQQHMVSSDLVVVLYKSLVEILQSEETARNIVTRTVTMASGNFTVPEDLDWYLFGVELLLEDLLLPDITILSVFLESFLEQLTQSLQHRFQLSNFATLDNINLNDFVVISRVHFEDNCNMEFYHLQRRF